jgi:hypothetical protein
LQNRLSAPTVSTIGRPERGKQMNPLLLGVCSVAGPLAAVGIYKLQAHLERWDAQRHAED